MFALLFLIAGLMALLMGYVMYQQEQYFKTNVIAVQGRIVEIRIVDYKPSRSKRMVHRPVIEYAFQGQTWHYCAAYDAQVNQQQVGDVLKIVLNPQRPALVSAEYDMKDRRILIMICFGLGIPFTGLGTYSCMQGIKNIQFSFGFDLFSSVMMLCVVLILFWRNKASFWLLRASWKKSVWGLVDNAQAINTSSSSHMSK